MSLEHASSGAMPWTSIGSPLRRGATALAVIHVVWNANRILSPRSWYRPTMALPLSQLQPVKRNKATNEAITGWHYWVAQGYCF